MIDFSLSPELACLRARVRNFIAEQVIPLENDPRQGAHGPHADLCAELVHEVATPAQKARWLKPLAAAQIRSCFCMTEPAPCAER